MRILFVAMIDSIHSARWIGQVADQGWDIHFFRSAGSRVHPKLENLTIHDYIVRPPGASRNAHFAGALPWPFPRGAGLADYWLGFSRRQQDNRGLRLARLIRKLKPDIVHSLEIQHGGYLTLQARNHLGDSFPVWAITNWGSDIYLFGRLSEHTDRIKAVLSACDYYWCECHRDVELARNFGFCGQFLPVLPIAGGFDLEAARQLRQPGPTSARRLIVLKGLQSWAGRALVGLRALELCTDVLNGYRVAVYMASQDVAIAAKLLSQSTGIPVDIIPSGHPREEILRLHGRARISIGLNVSDAISTSFLETIVMGSFPIQSHTACADEWVRDGEAGLLVPPEDPQEIAVAIRRALNDDRMVDYAAEQNARLVAERLDSRNISPQVVQIYERMASHRGT
jgi:hypothetical protein